jgi:hypothetical protein
VARPLKDSPYRREGRIIIGDRTIGGRQYRRRKIHKTKAAAGLALKVLNIAAAKDDFRWLMREPWDPEPYMRLLEGLPADGDSSKSVASESSRRRGRSKSPLLSAIVPKFKPIFRRGNTTGTDEHAAQNLDANIEAVNLLMGHLTLEEVAGLTKSGAANMLKPHTAKGNTGDVSTPVLRKRLAALYQLVEWTREPTGGNCFRGSAVLLEGTWKPAAPKSTTQAKHLPHYTVKQLIQLDKVCRSPGPDREEQIAFRFIRACILGGWRWAEVAGLSFDLVEDDAEFPEIEGVEVDDDYVIIGRAWKRKSKKWGPTKPGVAWTAVITPGLRAVISECHRENGGVGLLFPNPSRANEPFPYESFRKYLLAALDQARLKQKPGYLQKSLRHSFVHAAKRAGVPERWVSQHYGHSDEKMIRKVYGKRELRRTIPSKAEIREAENFFGFEEFVQKSMTA